MHPSDVHFLLTGTSIIDLSIVEIDDFLCYVETIRRFILIEINTILPTNLNGINRGQKNCVNNIHHISVMY